MKILASVWYTAAMLGNKRQEYIGVVAITQPGGKWAARIGITNHYGLMDAEKTVATEGAVLSEDVAKAYFPNLDSEKYVD
jgi:hypothetical protein